MDRILACIDGSPHYGPSVTDLAGWAAARMAAPVELLHVLDQHRERASVADLSGAIGLGASEELLRQLAEVESARGRLGHERGRALLDAAADRLRRAGTVEVATTLRHGTLVETVAEKEGAASLVVIGKRGEAADFARLHPGSNLERVARSLTRPLLVAARAFRPVARMLIAHDGGASADKAVAYAASMPLLRGLECHLLTVGNDDPATVERQARAAASLGTDGRVVRADILPGNPEEVIARAVAERGIDLLVMGAYGHSRIRSLLIGSTTTAMLRSCLVPVLMFR